MQWKRHGSREHRYKHRYLRYRIRKNEQGAENKVRHLISANHSTSWHLPYSYTLHMAICIDCLETRCIPASLTCSTSHAWVAHYGHDVTSASAVHHIEYCSYPLAGLVSPSYSQTWMFTSYEHSERVRVLTITLECYESKRRWQRAEIRYTALRPGPFRLAA